MRKIIHSIFMVLFYASPAPANSEFGGVKKIADELVGGKFHKISFDPACPDELNWKQVSDGKGVTGVRVSSGGKKLLFLFKRQGSFYNEFLPEPSVKMDYKEISKEIKKFEKELKKDKFPSPKHRYGAEAELAWLKSQMKKKAFSSQFLGISGDYLIFSGPGLGKMETDVRNALDKESQQATVQETSEKYEGMGEIRKISEDALEVSPLPYSHKRPYPADLFEKFPGVKTIIMQSVDAHALGPSGIQIENRKPLPALITGVYLPYFPEGAQKDKMKPLPALTLEITPPAEIIEGIPASFRITLKNPLGLIIVQTKGSSAYGDIYEKNGICYYDMLVQKETEPVFFRADEEFGAFSSSVFTKTGVAEFEFAMEIFDPLSIKPEHVFMPEKQDGSVIVYKKLKNFSPLKDALRGGDPVPNKPVQVIIPGYKKIPTLKISARIDVLVKEAAEIAPLKKKYNPEHYRYFPELSAWAFFLKEKAVLLKREAEGFAEIPAGNTSEAAFAMLSNAGKKHTIWVAAEKGCIAEFNGNFGKSNMGPDGDFMYHGDAKFVLSLPGEKVFDLLKCVDQAGYLFTTSAWSGFSGAELWILEKAK